MSLTIIGKYQRNIFTTQEAIKDNFVLAKLTRLLFHIKVINECDINILAIIKDHFEMSTKITATFFNRSRQRQ